jgi:hypothetical protein
MKLPEFEYNKQVLLIFIVPDFLPVSRACQEVHSGFKYREISPDRIRKEPGTDKKMKNKILVYRVTEIILLNE